jgi:predicted RNA-binding Zn-ribbon protein involved in translation (DUF1610 family)
MIELSADTACMLYLCVAISLILFQWYKSHKRLTQKKVVDYTQTAKTCEFCGHSFLKTARDALFRCPQCGCINSREKD